ncbi:LamG domain-containing protein [uncultured Sunxiuqinia sp.]|uniref:LamG domain-containing protein n=1 Tax=uncultured Sunxiuqinia sp. TaxID=1573825 RepID=UPI00262C8E90|nr:LamG domain-containing protein [uncultured Sunxiuqinia sp.]
MKKDIVFLLIALVSMLAGCDMSDYSLPEPDGRLLGVEVSLDHVDPRTGETETNIFEDFYRKDDQVQIAISSSKKIDKIDVVNSLSKSVVQSIEVGGNTASFNYAVEAMGIPFGQSGDLVFHLYYDDAGENGFSFPSIQSYAFTVISDIPSIVNFRKSDGSEVELRASDVNIDKYYEDSSKGLVAQFKPDVNSFLDLEDSPLLKFGANKNFSVSFWVQSDHDTSDPAMMGTLDWNSSDNQGWLIAWRNGRLRIVIGDGNGTKTDYRQDDNDPSLVGPEWHLVVVNFDRAGDSELFIDGELRASAPMDPVDIDNGTTVKVNQDGTGDYGEKLGAKYSQITFYDYVLTSDEVANLYQTTK